VELSRGPRENGHRPAIDALFRSAAETYGARVVGVVLSGTLDDGTDGLRTITDAGGRGIVQDPVQALYRTMPESAIAHGGDVEVMPVEQIGLRLEELAAHAAAEAALEQAEASPNGDPGQHAAIGVDDGLQSFLTCPECGGVLAEIEEGGVLRFRCRVGHQYSEQSLVALHRHGLEYALWMAVRALRERADLSNRVAERFRRRGHVSSARRFERDAATSLSALATLRGTMSSMEPPPELQEEPDA
jgi:two-component system chemotaxis response regulator CheB